MPELRAHPFPCEGRGPSLHRGVWCEGRRWVPAFAGKRLGEGCSLTATGKMSVINLVRKIPAIPQTTPLRTMWGQHNSIIMQTHIAVVSAAGLALLSLTSCEGRQLRCINDAVPYQYRVESGEDYYFATFLPLVPGEGTPEFFVSATSELLTDLKELQGGDPTGQAVTFKREGNYLVARQLGISLKLSSVPDSERPSSSSSSHGIERFVGKGATYTLASCDGILSDKFKKEFPILFR
jgi:hypothetical protein